MVTAYIVKGFRTAVAKSKKGALKHVRPDDLAVQVIEGLMRATPEVPKTMVEDVIVGNALPEAEGGLQVGRIIANRAIGIHAGGVTVNRYCASGLDTISMAIAKVQAGNADVVIAGGVESMSLLPMAGWKTVPNYDIAKANGDYYLSMGLTAEEVATDYKISREEQDRFAYESHQKALNAINKGYFEDGILPIEVEDIVYQDGKRKVIKQTFKVDEGPRADTTLEALAQLKPVFAQIGTVTAGNASQTSDGAAFVLVMSEASLKASGLKPWARMLSCVCVGVDPRIMGIGPIEAIPKALMKAQLKIEDIDLFEINEAFASQSLAIIKTLGLDPQKVNVNGGAIALGHPLGCSGAKLTIQLLHDLKRMGKQYGVVSACVGGGQGIAAVFERLD